MRIKSILTLTALFLFLSVIQANTIDTVASNAPKSIIESVNSESKGLSNYFSIPKIIISVIILLATYLFLKLLSGFLSIWAEKNTKHRISIKGFIPIIRIISWVGSLSFILVAVFHPPMASVLAFTASVGVAVGFAAQDLLKNIFGGIIIIFDKPFQIGDKVEIGNHYGEVVGIGLRSTRIITPDDNLVSVPNAEVMSQAVSNANAGEENCQVSTEIYLPMAIDIPELKKSGLEAAQTSKYVFLNKPIVILINQKIIGNRVIIQMKVKAYVNDIRNEFLLKSDITEVITRKYSSIYALKDFNSEFLEKSN